MSIKEKLADEGHSALVEIIRSLRTSPVYVLYILLAIFLNSVFAYLAIYRYAPFFYHSTPIGIIFTFSFAISFAVFMAGCYANYFTNELLDIRTYDLLFLNAGKDACFVMVNSHIFGYAITHGSHAPFVGNFSRTFGFYDYAIYVMMNFIAINVPIGLLLIGRIWKGRGKKNIEEITGETEVQNKISTQNFSDDTIEVARVPIKVNYSLVK